MYTHIVRSCPVRGLCDRIQLQLSTVRYLLSVPHKGKCVLMLIAPFLCHSREMVDANWTSLSHFTCQLNIWNNIILNLYRILWNLFCLLFSSLRLCVDLFIWSLFRLKFPNWFELDSVHEKYSKWMKWILKRERDAQRKNRILTGWWAHTAAENRMREREVISSFAVINIFCGKNEAKERYGCFYGAIKAIVNFIVIF